MITIVIADNSEDRIGRNVSAFSGIAHVIAYSGGTTKDAVSGLECALPASADLVLAHQTDHASVARVTARAKAAYSTHAASLKAMDGWDLITERDFVAGVTFEKDEARRLVDWAVKRKTDLVSPRPMLAQPTIRWLDVLHVLCIGYDGAGDDAAKSAMLERDWWRRPFADMKLAGKGFQLELAGVNEADRPAIEALTDFITGSGAATVSDDIVTAAFKALKTLDGAQ